MIKKYLIVALRTFRRNKVFSLINVLGLSIGISAALIIYLITQYDFSFDRFQKDAPRIYRVVTKMNFSGTPYNNSGVPFPIAAAVRKNLGNVEVSAFLYAGGVSRTTIPNSHPLIFNSQSGNVYTDNNYFRIFPFYKWLAGSPATLDQPYRTVISESRAQLYFPGLKPAQIIGRTIVYDDSLTCTVSGIVGDLTQNSDLKFIKNFISLPTGMHSAIKIRLTDDWGTFTSTTQLFVRLAPGADTRQVERQLKELRNKYGGDDPKDTINSIAHVLQPLTDIHFTGPYDNFGQRQANKASLYGLLLIAVFLLALGSINFINLTTAQAGRRAKEIGIRKTMGGTPRQLIFQFLSEAFLLTLMSGLLSLALTPWLLHAFSDFIPKELSFDPLHRPDVWICFIALILVVSLLSGFYPAMILSRMQPALVLKSQAYAGTASTRKAVLRKTLTVFQFITAQVFIIGAFIVSKQIRYSIDKDMGFNKEAIVFFNTAFTARPDGRPIVLKNKLNTIPGIGLVSLAGGPPAGSLPWSDGMTYNDGKKEIHTDVEIKNTDSNYIRIYGLKLIAGHLPLRADSPRDIVINQTYASLLGFTDPHQALGKSTDKGEKNIVGIIADFHQASLHTPIRPLALVTGGEDKSWIHFTLQKPAAGRAGWSATLAQVSKAFKDVYPDYEFEYHFVDDAIANFYIEEQHIAGLLRWATGLTIFISCLGLLGLVIYSTQMRVKEIGIRKVLGASIVQIVSILSKDFVKLVGIAFLIAVPIAWYGAWKWLNGFAYRTALSWWIFPLSGAFMITIAGIVLGIKTVRAASANPVESLRTE